MNPLTSGTVLVCFAVKEEAQSFRSHAADPAAARMLVTGMGRANAERAVREALATQRPALVLSCGFAGGLHPDLPSGSVVFAVDNNPPLEARLSLTGARAASFHCAERVVTSAAEKRDLRNRTGADAVEMESAAIGTICRTHNLPFAIVRVILDPAGEDLPLDFNRLMTPDQRMNYAALAGELLKSPGRIPGLLRLRRQSAVAARALAAVLARIL